MASVAADATAMSDVTLTPSVDTTIRMSSSVKNALTVLRVNERSEMSTLRCCMATSISRRKRRTSQRPMK